MPTRPDLLHELTLTIPELHRAYARGVSATEVMGEVLRRIAEIDDPGMFLHLADMDAIATACAALPPFDPATKPLWGAPFAVKDNIDVAGMPTTAACPEFAYQPSGDAFAVARLRAAGAIPIGKTNLDQFATGLVGVRTPYPAPRNALDPTIVPGGSSSGSAVAVAHGAVAFALGTDTAGSGRVPAALNNIVGLKPSLGAVSATGVVPACRTLDTVSVFALTVEDAVAAYRQMAAYDVADAFARTPPDLRPAALPNRFRAGAASAASRRFFGDSAQAASYDATLDHLAALGAEVVEVDLRPFFEVAALLYDGPWVAERFAAIRETIEAHPERLFPATRRVIEAATNYSAADAFDAAYQLADLKRALAPVLAGLDVLCLPSIPTFYSVDDLAADPYKPNARLGTYTNFVNLLDLSALTVPTGPRQDGRPGSITLIGPWGADSLLAAIGGALHRSAAETLGATDAALPKAAAPMCVDAAEDEIAVALVGAHMRGLPLNPQVKERGGRFLREAKTAARYQLYSLAGGPPKRPGMVRVEGGSAIALEIWAMPLAAFGAFMQEIPQPLGIGTIDLADGGQVKGFLCEPAGIVGAEEITSFGGWRAYLASAAAEA